MSLKACAIYECQAPATVTGLCAAHGNVPAKPGISEPALEERARRAGDMVAAEPPPAPVLDMGETVITSNLRTGTVNSTVAADPAVYVQACLRGEYGAMRRAVAEAMLRAVEQGLRAL